MMASTEVGTAYVAIIPSAKGFARTLKKEIAKEFTSTNIDKTIAEALAGAKVTLPMRPELDTSDIPDQVRGKEPTLPVRLDPVTEALQEEVRLQLAALSQEVSAKIPINAQTESLHSEISAAITSVEQQLAADIPTEAAGRGEYERDLRAMVDGVASRVRGHVKVEVEVDRPSLGRALEKIDVEVGSRHLGGRIGDGASKGMLDKMASSITGFTASPILLLAGAAVGVALASAISAAITGALLGGAGLGLIGLGALILKEQPDVAIAAKNLMLTAQSVFSSAAIPLIKPFEEALGMLREAVVEWGPQFRTMFELIAPAIKPLTEGLIGLVSNLLPGVTELIRSAAPFLISLAGEMPKLGEYLNAVFRIIDGGGPQASQFFSDLLTVVGLVVVAIAGIIRVATELYPVFRELAALTPVVFLLGLAKAAWDSRDAIVEFGSKAKDVFDRVVAFVSGAWRAVRGDTDGFISFLTGIPGRILHALGDLGGLLRGAGQAIIGGLIRGIKDMFGSLEGTLNWVTSRIPDWKGPADKDAKLLRPAGQLIMQGLIGGIHGERTALASELAGVTSDISVGGSASSGIAGYRAPSAPNPAPLVIELRAGAGDALVKGLRDHFRVYYDGSPDKALGSRRS